MNFNSSPYFDDYDSDKKFHRILYRPTFAVQARELTQQQTILQNQIERFGNHIFKNGAMVIPGQITVDAGVYFVKLNSTFDGAEVIEELFINGIVTGQTTGVTAQVINSSDIEGSDPKTLYVKYLSGANGYSKFINGEELWLQSDTNVRCKVQGSISPVSYTSTGLGASSSINSGIYYINGFFVIVDQQTIILSKYTNTPSVRVGLKLYEYLIAPEDDSSLNDNAQGSYNFAAPGAHRYKLDLLLEYVSLDDAIPEDFIELQQIRSGELINEIRNTEYNELEKTFARRTYDESGDYTVSPFNINIKEHLRNTSVPRFAEGKYTAADGGDESKIAIGIEPGKAYVRGYERNKLATTWIESNKARTVGVNNNSVTNFNIGQYIYVTNCFKMPDFKTYDKISLWDTASTDGNTAGTQIGSARVRAVELVDSTGGLASAFIYKIYIFDVKLDTDKAWSEVLWISSSDSDLTFTCDPTVGGDYADVDLQINEPTKKASIFKLPHPFIKTLKIDGSSDTTYTVQRTYPNVGVVSDQIVLSAGSNAVFDAFTGNNYILMDIDAIDSDSAFITITSGDVSGAGTGTIVIDLDPGYTNVRAIVPVVKQVAVERTKTLQTNRTFNIASPNQIPGHLDNLDRADGYRLVSVIDDPGGAAIDITSRYTFDKGQRDSYYDLCKIKLNSDANAPSADIDVTFDYFTHSSGDYCSVDSYSTSDYYDIPAYYSEEEQYDLSDCVDFRPVMDSSGDAFTGTGGVYGETPVALTNVRADYEHYLSRIDKLYIDYKGEFNIIEGTPAVYPSPPKSPNDGMVLYTLYMTSYTYSPQAVKVKFIENKRYTMRDIGRLENRISNLEYYTALSLLEKETAQFQIKDGTGLDRFKNGFIVEPFTSHAIGDSINNDYKCAIDPAQEIMRSTFSADNIGLVFDTTNSINVVRTGPVISLPYTDVSFITQTLASTTENVNPFAVRLYEGNVVFQPDSDNWYDTKKNGELVVNDDAHYEALEFIATYGKGLNGIEWNAWQTLWSSSSSSTSGTSTVEVDRSRPHDTGQVRSVSSSITTTVTRTAQLRTGSNTTHTAATVQKDLGDRTVGINYIPYMRSIPVLVKVTSMKPVTRLYPYFDDISVADYCAPAVEVSVSGKSGTFTTDVGSEEGVTASSGGTGTIIFQSSDKIYLVNIAGTIADGDTITGDDSGVTATVSVSGGGNVIPSVNGDAIWSDDRGRVALVFTIPNEDELKFRTGERSFILSDQVNNTEANQTRAEGVFKSLGSLLQQEGTVLSTKTIRFNRIPLEQRRTLVSVSTSSSTSTGNWFDPLAQTIMIEEKGGCFLTKADIYFQRKDNLLPVSFQIREVINGYPGQRVVPYSDVTLYPDDVVVSEDGSAATTFTMQAPVYLQQGVEYCFVLYSDSFDYNVWLGEIGQSDIITNELISKQPYAGVLFKSQNASAWTADQNQDLKFILYKARFQTETSEGSGILLRGETYLYNEALSLDELDENPLETFNGSTTVRVHQFAHGMTPDSLVTLSGFSGTFNNIPDTEINASHVVVDVELDSYTFVVTTAADDSGRTGGTGGYATRNVQMDVMRPNIAELILPETLSSWAVETTTHKSINGDQTDYQKSSSFYGINITENNSMDVPMMIASQENETNFMAGVKSLEFRNYMFSNNRNLSPIIDMNRAGCIAVANRIDSPGVRDITLTGGLATTNGSSVVVVTHAAHKLATGSVITVAPTAAIGGIPQLDLTGDFYITRITDNSYSFDTGTLATSNSTGDAVITYSNTHYKYVPESEPSGGSVASKYLTRKVTVEDPSVAVKILYTAVVMDNSEVEIWYRSQGPYDTSLFTELPWKQLTTPDTFVPISKNEEDFRDYEYTFEFTEAEQFTSIAIKLVMKSTDSTRSPIFDNLRVIALGT